MHASILLHTLLAYLCIHLAAPTYTSTLICIPVYSYIHFQLYYTCKYTLLLVHTCPYSICILRTPTHVTSHLDVHVPPRALTCAGPTRRTNKKISRWDKEKKENLLTKIIRFVWYHNLKDDTKSWTDLAWVRFISDEMPVLLRVLLMRHTSYLCYWTLFCVKLDINRLLGLQI